MFIDCLLKKNSARRESKYIHIPITLFYGERILKMIKQQSETQLG